MAFLFAGVGAALIVAGVAVVFWPAALVVAGVALMGAAWFVDLDRGAT